MLKKPGCALLSPPPRRRSYVGNDGQCGAGPGSRQAITRQPRLGLTVAPPLGPGGKESPLRVL